MSKRFWALAAVFVLFSIPTAICGWEYGVESLTRFFNVGLTDSCVMQGFCDLVVALLIVVCWMHRDARERGAAFWPFALLTMVLGSYGPLCYLIWRELQLRRAPEATPAAGA